MSLSDQNNPVIHSFNLPKNSEQSQNVVWQHIHLQNNSAQDWLKDELGLDSVLVEALSADETRPRSFKLKNGIMIILRGVNTNPGQDPEDMVSIRIWLEPDRIISAFRRKVVSISDIANDLDTGEGPETSGEFLVELVNKLATRINDFVESIDESLEDTEERIEQIAPSDIRSLLGSLRKQIATVRRYLAPQRDALDRLNHIDTAVLNEREKMRLREESDRLSRYLEDLDLARERAMVIQEALVSQIAQQQNNRMYALSIITAVFLPLGFITGLLGINVGGLPGVDNPSSFWIVCAGLFVVSIGIVAIFRRLKWL